MSNPPEKGSRAKRGGVPLAVGAYVPAVARRAFETHGFPSASILSDWPEIIGPDLADITTPERLGWPRGAKPEDDGGGAGATGTRRRSTGATLVLRVDGPRALEVQHAATQILERINVYFGYRAVSELRIVQGPVHRNKSPESAPPPPETELPGDATIEDEGLRAALSRLAASLD